MFVKHMIEALSKRFRDPNQNRLTSLYLQCLNLAQDELVALLPPSALVDLLYHEKIESFPDVSGELFEGGIYKKWNMNNAALKGNWTAYDGTAAANIRLESSHIIAVKRSGKYCTLIKSINPRDWDIEQLSSASEDNPIAIEMGGGIKVLPACSVSAGDSIEVFFSIRPRPMAYPMTVKTIAGTTSLSCTIFEFVESLPVRRGYYCFNQLLHDYTDGGDYYILNHVDIGSGGFTMTVNDRIAAAHNWQIAAGNACGLESDIPPMFHAMLLDLAEAYILNVEGGAGLAIEKRRDIITRIQVIGGQFAGVEKA